MEIYYNSKPENSINEINKKIHKYRRYIKINEIDIDYPSLKTVIWDGKEVSVPDDSILSADLLIFGKFNLSLSAAIAILIRRGVLSNQRIDGSIKIGNVLVFEDARDKILRVAQDDKGTAGLIQD
jgi:hypothetical protein